MTLRTDTKTKVLTVKGGTDPMVELSTDIDGITGKRLPPSRKKGKEPVVKKTEKETKKEIGAEVPMIEGTGKKKPPVPKKPTSIKTEPIETSPSSVPSEPLTGTDTSTDLSRTEDPISLESVREGPGSSLSPSESPLSPPGSNQSRSRGSSNREKKVDFGPHPNRAINIIPTFTLKGINPLVLVQKYMTGFFSRPVDEVKLKPIRLSSKPSLIRATYAKSNRDAVFSVKDRQNRETVFFTTNHVNYDQFEKTGDLISGGRCEYCLLDFSHSVTSYPIEYRETIVPSTELIDGTKVTTYQSVYTFWTEGCFCSFECALAYLRNMAARPSVQRDEKLKIAEYQLKWMYTLLYPEEDVLTPSSDPRLLQRNGGSLTEEQYRDKTHMIVRTTGVLIIPVKREYVRR